MMPSVISTYVPMELTCICYLQDVLSSSSSTEPASSICHACPLKPYCTSSKTGRQLSRHVGEEAFEGVRAFHQTNAYKKAMNKRQVWVEPLKALAKDWHGMRRFRLRDGFWMNREALRSAKGQNLKRLLKKRGWGRRPFLAHELRNEMEPVAN
jgi:hypothetical protein